MKKKILIIFAVVLLVLLCTVIAGYCVLSIWFNGILTYHAESDVIVQAPDGQRKLIIKEWGTFGATVADIYYYHEGVSLFKTRIGSTMADDVRMPFNDGDYLAEWEEDKVTLKYLSGRKGQTDDPETWERDTFEIPDHRYQKWALAGLTVLVVCALAIPLVVKLGRCRRAKV